MSLKSASFPIPVLFQAVFLSGRQRQPHHGPLERIETQKPAAGKPHTGRNRDWNDRLAYRPFDGWYSDGSCTSALNWPRALALVIASGAATPRRLGGLLPGLAAAWPGWRAGSALLSPSGTGTQVQTPGNCLAACGVCNRKTAGALDAWARQRPARGLRRTALESLRSAHPQAWRPASPTGSLATRPKLHIHGRQSCCQTATPTCRSAAARYRLRLHEMPRTQRLLGTCLTRQAPGDSSDVSSELGRLGHTRTFPVGAAHSLYAPDPGRLSCDSARSQAEYGCSSPHHTKPAASTLRGSGDWRFAGRVATWRLKPSPASTRAPAEHKERIRFRKGWPQSDYTDPGLSTWAGFL